MLGMNITKNVIRNVVKTLRNISFSVEWNYLFTSHQLPKLLIFVMFICDL